MVCQEDCNITEEWGGFDPLNSNNRLKIKNSTNKINLWKPHSPRRMTIPDIDIELKVIIKLTFLKFYQLALVLHRRAYRQGGSSSPPRYLELSVWFHWFCCQWWPRGRGWGGCHAYHPERCTCKEMSLKHTMNHIIDKIDLSRDVHRYPVYSSMSKQAWTIVVSAPYPNR